LVQIVFHGVYAAAIGSNHFKVVGVDAKYAGFGYKFLKDNRGELKLSVFDALKQNTSIARTVSESYIEDKNTQILTRFYMLTFTYSIRHFKVKPAPKDAGKTRK